MSAKKEQYFGWYSESFANRYGSVIYSTPDGKEVEVTEVVSDTWAKSEYTPSDGKFIGELKGYLRRGKEAKEKHPLEIAVDTILRSLNFNDDDDGDCEIYYDYDPLED